MKKLILLILIMTITIKSYSQIVKNGFYISSDEDLRDILISKFEDGWLIMEKDFYNNNIKTEVFLNTTKDTVIEYSYFPNNVLGSIRVFHIYDTLLTPFYGINESFLGRYISVLKSFNEKGKLMNITYYTHINNSNDSLYEAVPYIEEIYRGNKKKKTVKYEWKNPLGPLPVID